MSVFKYEAYCDGYGMLVCHCGGDLCVCGEDGQDCYGCEKCAGRDEEDFEDEPRQTWCDDCRAYVHRVGCPSARP